MYDHACYCFVLAFFGLSEFCCQQITKMLLFNRCNFFPPEMKCFFLRKENLLKFKRKTRYSQSNDEMINKYCLVCIACIALLICVAGQQRFDPVCMRSQKFDCKISNIVFLSSETKRRSEIFKRSFTGTKLEFQC